MDRRPMTRGGARKNNRRLITLLWIAGLATLIITLLYLEQTALLYLLATLGVTALLIIVALADLSGSHKIVNASGLGDDAAAIGGGITGTAAASSPVTSARRVSAKRK